MIPAWVLALLWWWCGELRRVEVVLNQPGKDYSIACCKARMGDHDYVSAFDGRTWRGDETKYVLIRVKRGGP